MQGQQERTIVEKRPESKAARRPKSRLAELLCRVFTALDDLAQSVST